VGERLEARNASDAGRLRWAGPLATPGARATPSARGCLARAVTRGQTVSVPQREAASADFFFKKSKQIDVPWRFSDPRSIARIPRKNSAMWRLPEPRSIARGGTGFFFLDGRSDLLAGTAQDAQRQSNLHTLPCPDRIWPALPGCPSIVLGTAANGSGLILYLYFSLCSESDLRSNLAPTPRRQSTCRSENF
jgi:hypothetical protein